MSGNDSGLDPARVRQVLGGLGISGAIALVSFLTFQVPDWVRGQAVASIKQESAWVNERIDAGVRRNGEWIDGRIERVVEKKAELFASVAAAQTAQITELKTIIEELRRDVGRMREGVARIEARLPER